MGAVLHDKNIEVIKRACTRTHTRKHTISLSLSLAHSICSPLKVSVLNQTTNQNPHKCLHAQRDFVRITKTSADLGKKQLGI